MAWPEAELADLVEYAIGGLWGSAPDSAKPDEIDVLVIRGANFRTWSNHRAADAAARRIPAKSLTKRRLQAGDLVLEVSGGSPAQPVGRVLVIDDLAVAEASAPLICSNFCRKLRLKPSVDPHFVKRQLDWLYRSGHMDRFQTSTTNIRNLQVDDFLRGTSIATPDAALQRALADALDKCEAMQTSSSTHVAMAGRAAERFRQAILAAACSGRLTEDWRQGRRDGSDAEALVLEAARRRGRETTKSAVAPADAEFVGEIPDSWRYVSLDAITARITSGSRDWSKYYSRGSGTFVMAQNVRPGVIDWTFRQAIDPPAHDPSRERSQIHEDDLLITIVGANTGDVGRVLDERLEHFVCQSVALARPAVSETSPYLNLWFSSPLHGQQYFSGCIYGAGRPHLSFDQLRATPIALPPLEEQREIVKRVQQLLSLVDALATRIDAARRRVDLSTQAVLTKAFRGDFAALGKEPNSCDPFITSTVVEM